jgi:hypothetical protein
VIVGKINLMLSGYGVYRDALVRFYGSFYEAQGSQFGSLQVAHQQMRIVEQQRHEARRHGQ